MADESVFDGIGIRVDALLADQAQVSEGKIFALGMGWNSINVPTLPVVLPTMALVAVVHVPYSETNIDHNMKVELHDQDGNARPLFPVQTEEGIAAAVTMDITFRADRNPNIPAGDETSIPMPLPFNNVIFDSEGIYNWVITIDGTPVKNIPLRVNIITPAV